MSKRQEIEHSPDLSKPSKEGLIWFLRHPELWNHKIEWDYGDLCGCGIGVYLHYWDDEYLKALKLSVTDEAVAFFGSHGGLSDSEITPFVVADTLERLGC